MREILFPIERAPFEFAISYSVYLEVEKKHDHHLNRYFYDLWDYWQTVIEEYNGFAFSGVGKKKSESLNTDSSLKGALSDKDFQIFQDAIYLESDAILTCDKYRNRQSWVYDRYGIMILYPTDFLEIIKDFKSLWS